jgi:putative membrane protein
VKPLVLCVDRDDDIGRKTGIKGPIVGREPNLEAAEKLALADPADTDVNALYGAIKLAGELETEVVTITGHGHVGIVSDKEITVQLEAVLDKLKPASIVFVSDGLDDEQVIPIIQSRVKIDSVQTITVRQSKELEKAYFKLANFIKEVTGDPALARLIFGLPGIALLLLALGGVQALSWIMGVVGLYLIIKGFGLEDEFFNTTSEFLKSLSVERVSTLLYVVAFFMLLVGVIYGSGDMQRISLSFTDSNATLNTVGLFILNSSALSFVMIGLSTALFAHIVDNMKLKKFISVRRDFILIAFIGLVWIVLDSGANYMINEGWGLANFIIRGLLGVLGLAVWIKLTEYFFKAETQVIVAIMSQTEGKEVADTEGRKLGKVSKAVVENLKLKEIRVGGKAIAQKDIVSIGEVIVVKKADEIASSLPQIGETIRHLKLHTPQGFQSLPNFSDAFSYGKRKGKQGPKRPPIE